MSATPTPLLELDAAQMPVSDINQQLRQMESAAEEVISIKNVAGHPNVCSGLRKAIRLQIKGNCGVFLGFLNDGGDLDVDGNVGTACGHSMTSGSILVRGHAGHALGAFAKSGFIGVHGSAQDKCGMMLRGADVLIRQGVGACAGYGMQSGTIVIGNDAGDDLGLGCTGGAIYLRGNAASVASCMKEVRMKDSDSMRLGLLLVRASIRAATKDFRLLRSKARTDE